MEINLTEQEGSDLARAVGTARQVRQWRRYRAIQLLAEGQSPQQVSAVLNWSLASVYNGVAAWQQTGRTGLAEGQHAGRARAGWLCRAAAKSMVDDGPADAGEQTTGWTVPLLHTRLTQAGYPINQRTLRRT